MRTLIADKFDSAGRDGLAALGCEIKIDAEATPEALPAVIASFDPEVLIVRSKKVSGAAIQAGRSLKLIVRAGAGVDNIDIESATARGIVVSNCPGMNAVAVAELTFGLLLSCDRRIPDQTAELRAGRWNKKEFSKSRGLKGSNLGVVGVGSIGLAVIQRAKAFEMNPIVWSRSMTPARAREFDAQFGGSDRKGLLAMLPECDAVTVHVAAAPETENLCDAEFFSAMRDRAYFINTSRGSVVDEAALADAVKWKRLRCGLDVYRGQPATSEAEWSSPLASLPGVYCTHHSGASTEQAQSAVAEEVVRIVQVYRDTGEFRNKVN